jgi:hypothetical protein
LSLQGEAANLQCNGQMELLDEVLREHEKETFTLPPTVINGDIKTLILISLHQGQQNTSLSNRPMLSHKSFIFFPQNDFDKLFDNEFEALAYSNNGHIIQISNGVLSACIDTKC